MGDWSYDEAEQQQQEVDRGPSIKPGDETVNHLMLIWTVGYNPDAPTQYTQPGKVQDCVYVDVVDLDQRDEHGQPGLLARRQWWFPGFLVGFLKTRVGKPDPVLAYLTRGTATKGKPPYQLVPAHSLPQARDRANEWRSRHQDFVPGQQEMKFDPSVSTPIPAANAVPPELAALQAQQAPATTMSMLEQLAEQSRRAASQLQSPPQTERPPF